MTDDQEIALMKRQAEILMKFETENPDVIEGFSDHDFSDQ
jgi:hypothetical protein